MEVPIIPPSAELIVTAGRLAGTRRPLTGPLTLLGRAAGCDVRLNVEDVQPLHAALVHGPAGFFLRDLAGSGGILVNDQPVSFAPARHGDVIGVGPFRFRLEVASESAAAAQQDALRVQAAAVAAQQAALTEEEMRLTQRRGALEEQEGQLAGRLDERRRRLLELQEQTRQDQAALQAARESAERERAAIRKETEAARDEASAAGKKVRAERQRLRELRKRLRLRWRRHWDAKEADLARREARLEREAVDLDRAQTSLNEDRLRLNGDIELNKRRMREEWQELGLAQQQWEACRNGEDAERTRSIRELEARAAAVDEAERTWTGRERAVRLMVAELHRESTGLEARIKHQREKLAEAEASGRREPADVPRIADVVPHQPAHAGRSPTADEHTVALECVAESLADQRVHLLEQWQALLRVQEEWRREREEALAGLESAGRSLHEREQRVAVLERRLDAEMAELRQRQQLLSQMRYSLEGMQARLKARDAAWDGERAALRSEVRAREEAVSLQWQRLRDLARQRELQRGKEAEELAAARARCEDVRRQYASLWEECRQRRAELAKEQRDLAARTLAVEQIRLEVVGKATNSARAERKMERLRRRNAARIDAAEREIETVRDGLAAEAVRLDDLAGRLQQQQEDLAARREELAREQAAWEERRAAAEGAEQQRRLELQRLEARREQDELVIVRLRDEVERVAALLMEQTEDSAPAIQAA